MSSPKGDGIKCLTGSMFWSLCFPSSMKKNNGAYNEWESLLHWSSQEKKCKTQIWRCCTNSCKVWQMLLQKSDFEWLRNKCWITSKARNKNQQIYYFSQTQAHVVLFTKLWTKMYVPAWICLSLEGKSFISKNSGLRELQVPSPKCSFHSGAGWRTGSWLCLEQSHERTFSLH